MDAIPLTEGCTIYLLCTIGQRELKKKEKMIFKLRIPYFKTTMINKHIHLLIYKRGVKSH